MIFELDKEEIKKMNNFKGLQIQDEKIIYNEDELLRVKKRVLRPSKFNVGFDWKV
jgi:hypothetical protein